MFYVGPDGKPVTQTLAWAATPIWRSSGTIMSRDRGEDVVNQCVHTAGGDRASKRDGQG